jgi:hypothetical protein
MRKRALVVIPCICAVMAMVAIGSVAYSTFAYTGSKAVARVSTNEKRYLDKFNQLTIGMDYDQVTEIMGTPDRDALGLRPTWKVNGSDRNQIAIYMYDGKVRRVRWLHLGRFVLEK